MDRVQTAATERAVQGAGEQGIVNAVYDLSGYPVQSLDQFGRLSVWAGPAGALALVTRPRAEYKQLCNTLARTSGSVRHGRYLVAYAVSRGEPLGVLAMFDPDHTANDDGLRVLDRAVLVLAAELAHKKTLAATRMGKDAWNDTSVWDALHDSMARAVRGGVGSLGVGGVAEVVGQVPRSYHQALQALRVRTGSVDPHGVTIYNDMGLYQLLVGSDADVTDFVREWLGPLIDYDRDRAADLTETLTVYLEQGGTMTNGQSSAHSPQHAALPPQAHPRHHHARPLPTLQAQQQAGVRHHRWEPGASSFARVGIVPSTALRRTSAMPTMLSR